MDEERVEPTAGPDAATTLQQRLNLPPMGLYTGPDEGDAGTIVVVDSSGDVVERSFQDFAPGECPDLEHCFGDSVMVVDEDGSVMDIPPGAADGEPPVATPIHDQQLARYMRQTYGHVEP